MIQDLPARSTLRWAHQRRFDSALIVLLALHGFARLAAIDQQKVEQDLAEDFSKHAATPYSA